jgi:hypothetical protein
MPAVFSTHYVKKLDGPNVKKGANWMELAEQLREDIRRFKTEKKLDRMVMVWCGSTEIYLEQKPVHESIKAFEAGLKANDPGHCAEHGLRLRSAQGARALRQRRAQPDRRHPGHDRAGEGDEGSHLLGRTSRPARPC